LMMPCLCLIKQPTDTEVSTKRADTLKLHICTHAYTHYANTY
ncbi:unnamed protein product, partial [Tetraodon nigroviridis]